MAFRYPITLDLDSRRCVVFGGNASAEDKVVGLLEAGAVVTVVAPSVTPGLA
ncbi:MAG TPA: NAD(P)-dependent oxidoreductase, partial [Actinomycetota bacterium]|nr:NAD(P)-dependent oxidoreductase [Actinomycetota bacterium]